MQIAPVGRTIVRKKIKKYDRKYWNVVYNISWAENYCFNLNASNWHRNMKKRGKCRAASRRGTFIVFYKIYYWLEIYKILVHISEKCPI